MMNIGYLLFIGLACIVLLNRCILLYSTFVRLTQERMNDLYVLTHLCHVLDYRQIGRHSLICEQIERRLSKYLLVNALEYVVNDTLYMEMGVSSMIQVSVILIIIVTLGALQARMLSTTQYPVYYAFNQHPQGILPMRTQQGLLKYD